MWMECCSCCLCVGFVYQRRWASRKMQEYILLSSINCSCHYYCPKYVYGKHTLRLHLPNTCPANTTTRCYLQRREKVKLAFNETKPPKFLSTEGVGVGNPNAKPTDWTNGSRVHEWLFILGHPSDRMDRKSMGTSHAPGGINFAYSSWTVFGMITNLFL